MLIATALTKPTSTELDTKRTSEPSRAMPRASIPTPVSRASTARASWARTSPVCVCGTSEMITAIAPVACTDISTVLVDSAPTTVPTR